MNIIVAVRTMRRAVPFFLCFFLVACTPTIRRTEYDQKCKESVNLHNTLTGQVYYQGSKTDMTIFCLSHSARSLITLA